MTTVLDWLDDPVPGRGIHFYDGDGWTFREYAQIAARARGTAALLRDRGLSTGVASLMIDDPQTFIPTFLGAMYAGLTPSPIASALTFSGHAAYLEHAGAVLRTAAPSVVLADPTMQELAAGAAGTAGAAAPLVLPAPDELPEPDSQGPRPAPLALLQFTSGSSGTPKGVRVSADNLGANVRAILGWLGVGPEDSCSSWLPLYHDMGLIGTFLSSVVAQIDLWLMTPLDFVRSPARWLDCHGRHGVTIAAAPNFGYAYTASRVRQEDLDGLDLSPWRAAMSGAERVDPRVTADFTRLLAPYGFRASAFAPCYGMAETTLAVSGVRPGQPARIVRLAGPMTTAAPVTVTGSGVLGVDHPPTGWLTSCGTPVPDTRVEVVDDDGRPLPPGHLGEIRVSGASVALGYESADPTVNAVFTQAGLRTGDAGFLLDGELFVVGRIGDSLKVRGRKVHAEDLEAALSAVPGVRAGRCAVALGTWQGRDRAMVLVEAADGDWPDRTAGVLRSVLDEQVAITVFRVPRGSIPRTSSGKPRRRVIWQKACAGTLPGDVVLDTAGPPGAGSDPVDAGRPAHGPTPEPTPGPVTTRTTAGAAAGADPSGVAR